MTLRGSRAFLAVPLILVNAAAIWGQAGWAYDNITAPGPAGVAVAILFAAAVESIGIYLAWESHEALMADQASALLRLGSYAVGVLAGVLNFVHFSAQSFATGVVFGGLSAISPWLWAIWSRARNRVRLAELGLVDVRGVKLSTSRKLWHPWQSLLVIRWAAWAGVTDPREAVAGWEVAQLQPISHPSTTPPGEAGEQPDDVEPDVESWEAKRDRLLQARAGRTRLMNELGITEHAARKLLEARATDVESGGEELA